MDEGAATRDGQPPVGCVAAQGGWLGAWDAD